MRPLRRLLPGGRESGAPTALRLPDTSAATICIVYGMLRSNVHYISRQLLPDSLLHPRVEYVVDWYMRDW